MAVRNISLLLLAIIPAMLDQASATRLKGSVSHSIRNRNLVLFLTRFGVKGGHELYVFGTAHRIQDNHYVGLDSRMTLAFIPQDVWNRFYSMSKVFPTDASCQNVMEKSLSSSIIVGENKCESGFDDYLRMVPCDPLRGDYTNCNQPGSVKVIPGSNFTYHLRKSNGTEFYYIFFIACTRNATENCMWASSDEVHFHYDITVVNSDPARGHKNHLDYHFSYEFHGVLVLEIVFTLIYLVLVIVHLMLHSRLVAGKGYSPHRLINIFTVSLVLEFFHVGFEMIHYSVYAANGSGALPMKYFGEVFNELSDWLLILVLILVAKGWQVTTATIRWKKLTSIVWCVYILVSAVYFVWMVVKEQVYPLNTFVEHPLQSWVGAVYLIYRMIVLVYSLYGMRQMYLIENRTAKLKLYVVLCVVYIIWFVYLPLAVILLFAATPVLRYMSLRTIILLFDLFINVFMLTLFCPKWSDKFFQFKSHINVLSMSKSSGSYKSLRGSLSYGSAPQIV